MRFLFVFLFCVACSAGVAGAGISVSSYNSVAQANAYAPLDKSAYYQSQEFISVSPAVGDVSADWTGTNIGGVENTWQMVASSHISTTTTSTTSELTITGAGSFSYDITTTSAFVEPTKNATLFTPGAGGGYQSVFSADVAGSFHLIAQLNKYGTVQLSLASQTLFSYVNFSDSPLILDFGGPLVVGQYFLSAGVGLSGPSNLPNGPNQVSRSGSFSSFSFAAQVPEPAGGVVLILGTMLWCRIRSRSFA